MNRIALALILALGLFSSGCVHNPTLTPAQQTQVNLYASLDLIASSNKAVTQSIVALNKAGTVGDTVTRQILDYNQQINDASRAALTVLDSTQTPEAKALAVVGLLQKLQLPPPVASFVNSNPSVSAVVALINSIVSIQQTIAKITATPPAMLSVAKVAP